MAVLLLLEYIFLSAAFNISPLLESGSWLSGLGYLGTLTPLIVIIFTSLALIGGKPLRQKLVAATQNFEVKRNIPLWIVHGCSFFLLVTITPRIYGSGAWLGGWAIVGVSTGFSALFLALPPKLLLFILRDTWRILLLGIAVGGIAWGAGLLSEGLWNPIGHLTFNGVASLVRLLPGEPIIKSEQMIVGTQDFSVLIAPICAGYQGLGLMLVFIAAYLLWQRKSLRYPHALVLVPISLLLVWGFNLIRIVVLIAIGARGYPGIALGGFHAKAGWLLFCALALGLVAVSRKFLFFNRELKIPSPDETWNPTAAYLLPFLFAVGIGMLTDLFSEEGVDNWYGLKIIVAGAVFWLYRRKITPLSFSFDKFAVLVGVMVGLAWIGIDSLMPPADTASQMPDWLSGMSNALFALWLLVRIVGSCVVIPVIEEVAFRGFVLRRMISAEFTEISYRQFSWAALIGSSIIFGLVHGRWLAGSLAGVAFALVVMRRGRLTDGVVAHAISNIVIAVAVVFFDKWALWL